MDWASPAEFSPSLHSKVRPEQDPPADVLMIRLSQTRRDPIGIMLYEGQRLARPGA
jgi:hypothetical protein